MEKKTFDIIVSAIEDDSNVAQHEATRDALSIPTDIKSIMEEENFSIRELARQIGVDHTTVIDWMNLKTKPDIYVGGWIHKWAERLRSQSK